MITTASSHTFGVGLDSAEIERGLRELNKDFGFDVAVRRPSDWEHVIQFPSHKALEAYRQNRLPVTYGDRYITGLDRGFVPEFKQWSVEMRLVEVPWYEADKEDVAMAYQAVDLMSTDYIDLYIAGARGNDPTLQIMSGRLYRLVCRAYRKVRGRIVQLGWRHTFENIINAKIPGATREAIGAKFKVDMMKFPVGAPDELIAALVEE